MSRPKVNGYTCWAFDGDGMLSIARGFDPRTHPRRVRMRIMRVRIGTELVLLL
jgi:hypothetical protein